MDLKDIYPAVVVILMVGIVLGIGLYVLAEMSDQLATTSGTVSNETGLFINDSIATVDQASANGFNTFAVSACYGNVSGGSTAIAANATITSGNYTVDSDAGTIVGASGRSANYTEVKCSYTYLYGGEATGAIDTTKDGLGDFAGWIAVIVVVIAAAVVLGIVLRSFSPGMRV